MRFSLRTLFVVLTLVACVGGFFRFMILIRNHIRVTALRRSVLADVSYFGGYYRSNKGSNDQELEQIDLIRVPDAMSGEVERLRRIFPEAEVVVDQNLSFKRSQQPSPATRPPAQP